MSFADSSTTGLECQNKGFLLNNALSVRHLMSLVAWFQSKHHVYSLRKMLFKCLLHLLTVFIPISVCPWKSKYFSNQSCSLPPAGEIKNTSFYIE